MADTAPVPLVSLVAKVEDPRRPQARLHTLEDMLLIATLAVICGTGRGTEVELLGYQKQVWLATFLALPHGIPSHDTFGRVCARLAPTAGRLFHTLGAVAGGGPPFPRPPPGADTARRVEDHSHASTAIPDLLAMLVLEGCIVTIDRVPLGGSVRSELHRPSATRGPTMSSPSRTTSCSCSKP